MKILVKNGRVIDPARNFVEICDVAVAAGRIGQQGLDLPIGRWARVRHRWRISGFITSVPRLTYFGRRIGCVQADVGNLHR